MLMKLTVQVLLVMLLFSVTLAASDQWLDHQMNQAYQKLNTGDTDGAIDLLRNSMKEALQRDDIGDEETAMIASELAMLYMIEEEFSRAEPFMIKALKLEQNIYGKDNSMTVGTLNNLALLYSQTGKLSQAEALYKKIASIWRAEEGPDDPNIVDAQLNLIDIYEQQGRMREAQDLREKIKNIEDPFASGGSGTTIIDDNQVIFTTEGGEEEWNAPLAGQTVNYTRTHSNYSVSPDFAIKPCVDTLTYDSSIGRKAVEQLLKGSGGVYERSTKMALIKLYTDFGHSQLAEQRIGVWTTHRDYL